VQDRNAGSISDGSQQCLGFHSGHREADTIIGSACNAPAISQWRAIHALSVGAATVLRWSDEVRIHLELAPVDMRRSFDGFGKPH
jgi:hypothetical protein